jgi:hypothetical protein
MGIANSSGTLLEKLRYNTSGLCRSYDGYGMMLGGKGSDGNR